MDNITLHKQDGVSYHSPIKVYDLVRGAEIVGYLQTWGAAWEVLDAALNQVSRHTTIKAAARVAGRVL